MCIDLIDVAMGKLKDFDVVDIGIFKFCLISFGILLGVFANKFFKKISPLIAITFIVSYIYLMYQLFSDIFCECEIKNNI